MHPFVIELDRQHGLLPAEMRLLDTAGARTVESAHSLLAVKSPRVNGPIAGDDRRRQLRLAMTPSLSPEYRQAVKLWRRRRPRGTGAAAPSAAALAAVTPVVATAALPAAGVRLDGAGPIDLVGAARYPRWLAEDQGRRGTCVAFAVAACAELRSVGGGTDFPQLSPQFLYAQVRARAWPSKPPGWANGAIKLSHAKAVLAEEGICDWDLCRYPLAPATLTGPSPSPAAKADALLRRFTFTLYGDWPAARPTRIARMVYEHLDQQRRPVAIAVPVFVLPGGQVTNWDNPNVMMHGKVHDPPAGAVPNADTPGHAVCVVGFQPDAEEVTGGWFIFRNSAGLNWASSGSEDAAPPQMPHPGFGAISASYVEKYCWELLG